MNKQFRLLFIFFISVLFLTGCKMGEKKSRKSITKDGHVHINWALVSNMQGEGKDHYLGNLSIIADETAELAKSGWELHFSHAPCRLIDTTRLPEGIKIKHVNGDYFIISPTASFAGIKSDDTLNIEIYSPASSIKTTDAPGGFFFVYNAGKDDEKIVEPKYDVTPYALTAAHLHRHGKDVLPIPTSEYYYDLYSSMSVVDKEEVSQIIPVPHWHKFHEGSVHLDSQTGIYYDGDLAFEANYLATALGRVLESSLMPMKVLKMRHLLLI